jgi:hypothetical protein
MNRIQKTIATLASQSGFNTSQPMSDGEILSVLKVRFPYSQEFLLNEIARFRHEGSLPGKSNYGR